MEDVLYKLVMKNSPMAFAYHKIILDDSGAPCDYVFLEVNRSFEEMTGLKGEQIIGKRVTEVIPGIRQEEFDCVAAYGITALQGGTAEYEQYIAALGRWYRIQVYSPEIYYFAVNFLDVSKEKQQVEESGKLLKLLEEKETEFHRIIENLPFSFCINRMDGDILYINAAGKELFELEGNIHNNTSTVLLWANPGDRLHFVHALEEKGTVKDFEMYLQTRTGKSFWATGSGMLIEYQNQTCILSTQHDITEQKKAEDALKASEEKYRLITEFASDMIWVYNYTRDKFTYVSPSFCHELGYLPEEALKLSLGSLIPEEYLIEAEQMNREHLKKFLENPEESHFYITEVQNIHKNGKRIWIEASSRYCYNAKREIEVIGVSRNIEERRKTEQRVLYLSYHDQLTGLYNRRFYEEELKRLDTGQNLPITLILADVNGLKLTNDAFGHLAGDQLLIRTSQILTKECRRNDIIARIGGDEFVLILPKTGRDEAKDIINRIKKAMALESRDSSVLSVSFGYAAKAAAEQDLGSVFIEAENAMYRHKLNESSSMRNKTIKIITQVFYNKSKSEEEHNKRVGKLSGEIARAMDMNEEAVNEIITAGSLHDIGKIGIDEKLLYKQEPFTEQEWVEYKRHPEIGYQILKSSAEFTQIAQYVLCHHERMDGTGYPRGIPGHAIPVQARIISIADAYDTMLNPRAYQVKRDEEAAVHTIKKNAGTKFDGAIARIFVEKVLCKPWNRA